MKIRPGVIISVLMLTGTISSCGALNNVGNIADSDAVTQAISQLELPDKEQVDNMISNITDAAQGAATIVEDITQNENVQNVIDSLGEGKDATQPDADDIKDKLDDIQGSGEGSSIIDNAVGIIKDKLSGADKKQQAGELEEVSLVRVVDGDTIVIVGSDSLEYKVRLIGIDTPESVHEDASKNNEYGQMASDHTKEILSDYDTLYLEYDEQVTDTYNRVLAYVWLSDDTSNIQNMLNAKILSDGYAVDKVYKPNKKYAKNFKEICNASIKVNNGLWANQGYHDLTGR